MRKKKRWIDKWREAQCRYRKYVTHYTLQDTLGLLQRKNIYDLVGYNLESDGKDGYLISFLTDGLGDNCYEMTFYAQPDNTTVFEIRWRKNLLHTMWSKMAADAFFAQKLDAIPLEENCHP